MPLQNRVGPFGQIFQSPSRGTWTGNRGVIHRNKKIVAPFKAKYWITCSLMYKDFHREVMTEKRWTELFFLDEVTAFSAGHRPCGFCRNKAYKLFKQLWFTANGEKYELKDESVKSMDYVLHQDRLLPNGQKKTYRSVLGELPDGVMIQIDNRAYLFQDGYLLLWDAFGYQKIQKADLNTEVIVLTPSTMVDVLRRGYICHIHESGIQLLEDLMTK